MGHLKYVIPGVLNQHSIGPLTTEAAHLVIDGDHLEPLWAGCRVKKNFNFKLSLIVFIHHFLPSTTAQSGPLTHIEQCLE